VTSGIRANPNPTPMSRQALKRNGVGKGPHLWRGHHKIGQARLSRIRISHQISDGGSLTYKRWRCTPYQTGLLGRE